LPAEDSLRGETRFLELPQARPTDTVLPEPLAGETAFDWSEVDRRISTALDKGRQQRTEHTPSDEAGRSEAPADLTGDKGGSGRFTTAAEASVIGPIAHSPRHRMLFGTRWR
jgi:hypothetical protein